MPGALGPENGNHLGFSRTEPETDLQTDLQQSTVSVKHHSQNRKLLSAGRDALAIEARDVSGELPRREPVLDEDAARRG